MQHGGGFDFPFGRVKLTLAFHGSVLPDGSNGGNPCGFLLFLNDGKSIYDAADTGLFGDMKLIGEEGIDLAILPDRRQLHDGARRRPAGGQAAGAEEGPADPLQHLAADRPGRRGLGRAGPQGDRTPRPSCSSRANGSNFDPSWRRGTRRCG